jgi:hypothetical protein
MRWNPISDRRKVFLKEWLANYLRRQRLGPPFRDAERYKKQYNEELEFHWSQIDNVAATDPTHSGEYCRWIMWLLLTNQLRGLEDYDKIRDTLVVYHRIKKRLPLEHRNIDTFRSYSELFNAVRKYLPKTWSKQELERMGQKIIYEDEIYVFMEITTPEAAVAASKNMGWCTCNAKTAADYLEKANLYVVYRNSPSIYNETFLLVHIPSGQVMLEGNEPYTEYEPHLMEIFAKVLPDIHCSNHKGAGELKNKICYSCQDGGCCEMYKCAHPNCPHLMCPECVKICVTCEVPLCDDHIAEECRDADCAGPLCQEDYKQCDDCREPMCASHSTRCDICDLEICHECAEKCYSCGNDYCPTCRFECQGCNDEVCNYCAEKNRSDDACTSCEDMFCEGCMTECDECGSPVCGPCYDDAGGFCNPCRED